MKKSELESIIGRKVKVIFFDGSECEGILEYTPEFSAKYDYRKPNYFNVGNYAFKVSHIRSLKVLD